MVRIGKPRVPSWIAWWIFASSLICIIDALYVILRPRTMKSKGGDLNYFFKPYNIYAKVDKRYEDLDDSFVRTISWMNVVEVLFNFVTLALHIKDKRLAVVFAFMVSTMMFAKTVFYLLGVTKLCHGNKYVGHNDWLSLIGLFIIPNGLWVILPFFSMLALGRMILDCLETTHDTSKGQKSN